jgi:hypothetical protein
MKGLKLAVTQLGLLFMFASAATMHAQVVIGSPVGTTTPVTYAPAPSTQKTAQPLSNIASAFANQGPLAVWGPIALRPHFAYSVIYGDGILRVPGEPANTTIQTLSAGILTQLGKYTSLDYTLTQTFYSSRLLENNSGEAANLSIGRTYEDWNWDFSQSYASGKPTLVETAQQTDQQSYSTMLSVGYQLGERAKVSLSTARSARLAGPTATSVVWTGSDWIQWSATASLNYTLSPKLSAGASMGFGYDEVSGGNNMTSSRPQLSLFWHPTDKLTFSLQRGVEERKFEDTNAGKLRNPIYTLSANYRPLPTTTFFAGGTRNISASYFNDQIVRSIQWNAGIEQRFFQKFYFTGSVSNGKTAYISMETGKPSGRDDRYVAYSARLRTQFVRRGTIGLSYDLAKNSSTAAGFTFDSHQIGCDIGYRY